MHHFSFFVINIKKINDNELFSVLKCINYLLLNLGYRFIVLKKIIFQINANTHALLVIDEEKHFDNRVLKVYYILIASPI